MEEERQKRVREIKKTQDRKENGRWNRRENGGRDRKEKRMRKNKTC